MFRDKFLLKKYSVFLVIALMVFLVSCAGVQEKWNTLTPDAKARVVIDGIRVELDKDFEIGKAYVAANPKYKDVWVKEALPAFETSYKILYSIALTASTEGITPAEVYNIMQPSIDSVVNLLVQMGALKGGVK